MKPEEALLLTPEDAAQRARLRYVDDRLPGLTRRPCGKGFSYYDARGNRLRDAATLERIRALVIPPAWRDVWICPYANGHIQATGRDAKGRKQYLYHERWIAIRDDTKFSRLVLFGRALPALRERVTRDLARRGVPRRKVLAAAVRLLDETLIRVGNKEYVRRNQSFGLTTLTTDHVDVRGATLRFEFRGKSGKYHTVTVSDRRLARVVRQCQELPGHELFGYLDDEGHRRTIESEDVNEYLEELTGQEFTAKDFRTWGGTATAVDALIELGPAETAAQADKRIAAAVKQAAKALGNTPAVCRRSYIHPAIFEAYRDGRLQRTWETVAAEGVPDGLRQAEAVALALLAESAEAEAPRQRAA